MPFGTDNNSEKNNRDARIRKVLKNGAKIRFPRMLSSEKGNPHQRSMGKEISMIKS